MVNLEVKNLFNYNRFPETNILLLLYIPFGCLLVAVRIILLLIVLLLATVLPRVKFLQVVFQKLLCLALGISINAENVEKKEDVDAFVSNQLSVLDGFIVHLLTHCLMPAATIDTQLSKLLGNKYFGPMTNLETIRNNIALFKNRCTTPLFLQPESAITNGSGLLKFSTWSFSLANKIQPVLLEINRPLFKISLSTIGSSYWTDILYFMFAPMTVYKVRFMPSIEKKAFNDDEFSKKIQLDISKCLNIPATEFTASDLREYQKRYIMEQQRVHNPPVRQNISVINPELQRMGNQVKEVLPMVPINVIYRDLAKTRNVDVTITNILEGHVVYEPEAVPTPSTSSQIKASCVSTHSSMPVPVVAASNSKDPFNTAASTFGKSASERMLSFQERKAQLIANARQRYIEKHGLSQAMNNC